jgi:hypothetical protein
MSRLLKCFVLLLLLCFKTNTAWSEGYFDVVNPNAPHDELMEKARDSSAVQNGAYITESIQAKVRLHSENQLNQAQPAAGNSVVIENGATVNGDMVVNIQVNGDTYVAGR